MTKSELISILASTQPSMTKLESEAVVNAVFDAISEALAKGEHVELRGFGSFTTRTRQSRVGRNPKTGDTVSVGEKKVPYFKPGKLLREGVLSRDD
ncbi:MAG: integration host factor subunit beta [Mariprofundaceae bacterium]|nr:integration host factor subunit beta [Mariprofundaceae bacterium]